MGVVHPAVVSNVCVAVAGTGKGVLPCGQDPLTLSLSIQVTVHPRFFKLHFIEFVRVSYLKSTPRNQSSV